MKKIGNFLIFCSENEHLLGAVKRSVEFYCTLTFAENYLFMQIHFFNNFN